MSTETTPDGSTSTDYQVVCGSHGVVQDGIKDWIAAEIIRDEHREGCPAERIEWIESEPFEKASSIERTSTAADRIEERNQERHGGRENHCPNCGTFITTDRPTECDDCGVTVRESNDGDGDMVTLS
jgi:hypothetical protein